MTFAQFYDKLSINYMVGYSVHFQVRILWVIAMRTRYAVLFALLVVLLGICAFIAKKSKKQIGGYVAFLEASVIVPILGNIIIVITSNAQIAKIGYYIYFLGMDLLMLAFSMYIIVYCNLIKFQKPFKYIVYTLIILDVIQYIFDIFFDQAFAIEETMLDGRAYYRLIAYWGQVFHRVVDYGIILAILVILVARAVRSARIYAEKYYIIIISLAIGIIAETFFVFSRTPIDRAMIGFAIIGFFVFYFSIYYRPLRLLDQMLANIASEMSESIFFFDGNSNCIWANDSGKKLVGEQVNYDQTKQELSVMFPDIDWYSDEWRVYKEITRSEETKYYLLERHTIFDERRRKAGFFISIEDNTEAHKELERERYNATHDSLTDLYTKEYLFELIEKEIKANPDEEYLIIHADVSDFKIVNDIFGNDFGDVVLKYIAMKIRDNVPENAIYGRLVSDTFGICIKKAGFDKDRFIKEITRFTVSDGENDQNILIHLGIYETMNEEISVAGMFDRARIALSTVKGDYQTMVAYYDEEMRKDALWGQHISTQLQTALAEKQIRPFLQPIVDNMGKVVGAEALVRWIHPQDGYLSPARFIPVFEDNGMIAEVDKYMWRSVCEILSRWKREGKRYFLSINISPKDFYFMDVVAEIKGLVKEYNIEPEKLRIEITETVMMSEDESRFDMLNEFRNSGFIVEMDDFGSGYSSLNLLKDMPVDLIKVDMEFLRNSNEDEKSKIILKNILNLTEDLGLISLTEGVETEKQFKMLSEMGCKLFQGYYFSKPMTVKEFEDYLRK